MLEEGVRGTIERDSVSCVSLENSNYRPTVKVDVAFSFFLSKSFFSLLYFSSSWSSFVESSHPLTTSQLVATVTCFWDSTCTKCFRLIFFALKDLTF